MTPVEEIIEELGALRKELGILRRRRNQTLVQGTVEAVEGGRVKVRLADDGEDGPVTTPWLRVAEHTGKRQAGVSKFVKYGVGEAVLVVSPNGEIGTMSAVQPWIDTEDDPVAGAAETDGDVTAIGDAKLEVRNGFARLSVGGLSITLQGDTVTIAGKLQVNGESLKHNARNVGDSHIHGGVMPGGANTSVPAN